MSLLQPELTIQNDLVDNTLCFLKYKLLYIEEESQIFTNLQI